MERYRPYSIHAQRLIAGLETFECGAAEILHSDDKRTEALAYAACFVQLELPDDPERFGRIARRVVDFMAQSLRESGGQRDHRLMVSGVADILREELGLPEIPHYE